MADELSIEVHCEVLWAGNLGAVLVTRVGDGPKGKIFVHNLTLEELADLERTHEQTRDRDKSSKKNTIKRKR